MPNPLVSIIVPLPQYDALAEEALLSIVDQPYAELEIFLVSLDEGIDPDKIRLSLNGKSAIWEKVVFHSASNKTVREGLNEALRLVKGDYITFLMPSDYYHPLRIQRCVARLLDEEAEFLFTKVVPVNEKSQTLAWEHKFWRWKQLCEFHVDVLPTVGFKLIKDNVAVTLGNVFFSKRVVEEVVGFGNYQTHYAYDFILRALLVVEPVFFKEELYFYRVFMENEAPKDHPEPDLSKHKEAAAIQTNYLFWIQQKPKNPVAPSHHNWPMTFSTFRMDSGLDLGFEELLEGKKKLKKKKEKEKLAAKGKKITLLIHDLSLSGSPKVVADLALALKDHGYAPRVLAFFPGPMQTFFEREKIPVEFIDQKLVEWHLQEGFTKIVRLFSMAWKMFRKTSKTTISVTAIPWPAMIVAVLIAPFRNFIWYLHDSYAPEAVITEGMPFKLFQRCLKSKNLRFWFGSKATRSIWQKAEVTGEVLYWSGIPQSNKKVEQKPELKKLLAVGGGYARKGVHFLVDAFISCLKEKRIPEDTTLTIVGFPYSLKDLQQFTSDVIIKIKTSDFADRITLVRPIPEERLLTYYAECDLYIHPSLLECIPLAMLQAMSMGIPVIASDVDGCPEAIQDGINGFLCPPRSAELLADKIVEALSDPIRTQELGLRGKETFEQRFATEVTIPALIKELHSKANTIPYHTTLTENTKKRFAPLTDMG